MPIIELFNKINGGITLKKKQLIATLAAAFAVVSLSPTIADAAKIKDDIFDMKWSTKTKYEWVESGDVKNKTEVKTLISVRPDAETYFGLQLKFKQSNSDDKKSESNKISMEDVWMERTLSNTLTARVGSMPLTIGPGLWLDGDGLAGAGLRWQPDKKNTFNIVTGKDSQEDTVKNIKSITDGVDKKGNPIHVINYESEGETSMFRAIAWEHDYGNGDYGLYVGQQDVSKYRGAFGSYALNNKLVLTTEFVKNTGVQLNGKDTTSKVVELKYGKLKKAGDIQYVATYLNSDPGVFVSADYTAWDDNYNEETGFKGIGATINYKLSKSSQLQLEQFWGDYKYPTSKTGKSWRNTGLKLTSKF